MLNQGGQNKQAVDRSRPGLLLFSVGGRRLAAMMEEVVGVMAWNGSIPVAGETPFVSGLVRQDQVVLPVFDLAARIQVAIAGGHPLCLVAKHPLGNLAICIDETVPVMRAYDSVHVQGYQGNEVPAEQTCVVEGEEIPILYMAGLLSH